MRVLAFKFLNGQEIVAEVIASDEVSIRIKNPLTTEIVADDKGNPTLAFGQWSFTMAPKTEIDVIVTSLMTIPFEVHQEIANSYEQQFSSIILSSVPSAKKILKG